MSVRNVSVIPAVFFQKQLDGVKQDAQKPERLALYESQLREVVGRNPILGRRLGGGKQSEVGPPDGSGGFTTYSGSAGWADVMQADDCAA